MKTLFRYLTVLVFCAISQIAFSQPITSVQSGNWLNPTTWDCSCIPTPGSIVVVEHAVALNTDWAYSSGSITINPNGSLLGAGGLRTIAVYGTGSFVNNGTLQVNKMAIFSGTISNNGSLTVTDSLYLNIALTNGASGTIVSNNFYSGNHLINNGTINAVNFLNNGIFENFDQCHFTDFFNNLTGQNSGIIEFYDFYNNDSFANTAQIYGSYDFTNAGEFHNTGNIRVDHDFANTDSINSDAYFNNMGHFYIANDMINFDTLTGSSIGQYCIGNNSTNAGVFLGDFDFCDLTPPATAPFIDLNSGTISTNVTYCATPCTDGVAEEIKEEQNVILFPNPASDMVFITSANIIEKLEVLDISGKLILQIFPNNKETSLFIDELDNGVYFVKIQTEKSVQVKKLQIL